MGFVSWIGKKTLQLGVVAAALKVSIDNDVWSLRSDVTEKSYENFKKTIVNGTIVYKEKLLQNEGALKEAGSKWNDNVNCAFNALNNSGEYVTKKVNEIYKSAEKLRASV
ncbi:MICOS complex subunit MIC13 [Aphelenchoides bicaudatus]|nr:MICOS complex subunit MIC13 [Aphelenchoides bicaudatus]